MDFTPPDPRTRWFACRTRGRAEKAIRSRLDASGIRCYLPLLEKKRRWADRTRTVRFPLFPGYIFVLFRRNEISVVLADPGLVDVVRLGGSPSPVPPEDLASVHALVTGANETGVMPSPADYLEVGDPVHVTEGPFKGMKGILIEARGRTRAAVKLDAIRQAVSVELEREWLEAARRPA